MTPTPSNAAIPDVGEAALVGAPPRPISPTPAIIAGVPGGPGLPALLLWLVGAVAAVALLTAGLLWQKLSNMQEQLARQSAEAGAQVDFVVAYQRSASPLSAQQQTAARAAAGDGSVWLFSSSEAIANLAAGLPGQSWQAARAVVTHPRIAIQARKLGFGVVCESRPLLASVVASLESMG